MKFLLFLASAVWILTACKKEQRVIDNELIVDAFWYEISTYYAYPEKLKTKYFDYQKSQPIDASLSESYLAIYLGQLLDSLQDAHVHLYTPWHIVGNSEYFNSFKSNSLDDNSKYFDSLVFINKAIQWGRIKNTTFAYIKIRTFDVPSEQFTLLDSLILIMKSTTEALVIDVRGNRGGWVESALNAASFFTASPRKMGTIRYCIDAKLKRYSSWQPIYVNPETLHPYNKPIVVITDRYTYSASEWFVLAMTSFSNVKVIGDTTGGGTSIPVVRELPNGWLLSLSNSQLINNEGLDIQFKGYPPDVTIIMNDNDKSQLRDTPLELAIKMLDSSGK
ncbi:MAG: S41 family peptidase [Bacteroidales bacterium]|nr:S41 family peptidase [Bacteroidales bacterium]